MDAKYVNALIIGFSMGAIIACFTSIMTVADIWFVTCFGLMFIVFLAVCIGALSVWVTRVTTLADALVVSVLAGLTAAIINVVALVLVDLALSVIYQSLSNILIGCCCWSPIAIFIGVIFPVIGGCVMYLARAGGLVK